MLLPLAIIELVAIIRKDKNDTLSENTWITVGKWWLFGSFGFVLMTWLLWHFYIEPAWFPSLHRIEYKDDLVLAIVTFMVSLPTIRKAHLRYRTGRYNREL